MTAPGDRGVATTPGACRGRAPEQSRPDRRAALVRAALASLASVLVAGCSLERDVASNTSSGPHAGSLAPPLRATALDGRPVDLAAARGHPVVVDFFASWCGPCRAQQPALDALARRYLPQGVVVLGVDVREGEAETAAYVREFGVPYPTIHDDDGSIAAAFDVLAPPTTVVIDPSGRIVSTYLGGVRQETLAPLLDRLLGEAGDRGGRAPSSPGAATGSS